jgi:hypothetical protein
VDTVCYNIFSFGEENMAGYTREFLLECFASRYEPLGLETTEKQYKLASDLYDQVGKDKFRVYASLDAEAIRNYKNTR